MLQAQCLSAPINGRSHFKKFWLRKLEKEEDLIDALHMSSHSAIVSQQSHEQMSASLSTCDYRKFIAKSLPCSLVPITGSAQSIASSAIKFESIIDPCHVQLLKSSTCGSENSDKSLVTRTIAFDDVHIAHTEDEEAEKSLETLSVECTTISCHNENRKDCSAIDCKLSLLADNMNIGRISPRHSRSGSPVLVTSGPKEFSKKLLQSPGLISLHGDRSSSFDDGNESKQDLEIDFTDDIHYKSVHIVQASGLNYPLQETCSKADLLPISLEEIVVEVKGQNAQLCSAFQPVENNSKRLHVMPTFNQGNAFTACASTSYRSAFTGLRHKIMHSDDGTDGETDNMLEHRSSLHVRDFITMWRTSGTNPRETSERNPDAENSRTPFCSESRNARSPSKEFDNNDKSEKASECRQTSLFSRHLSSTNEFSYRIPPFNSKHQFHEGGSMRNSSPRTCSHCGTIKTPLWRSGPLGPKSLCNACGIRLKKAGNRRIAIRDNTDNSDSVSPISSPNSAAKLTNKPSKRKLDKTSSSPVDSWFARARLKAPHNHNPKLNYSKKSKTFSAQARKIQSGKVFCKKTSIINKKNQFSPSVSPMRTYSASTHESPVIYDNAMPASQPRKRAKEMQRLEIERLDTANPIRIRRSFSEDEEEGAVLLMALSSGFVKASHENPSVSNVRSNCLDPMNDGAT